MKKDRLIINPKTKIATLLDSYPELEVVLVEYLPSFKVLQNPKLKETISKVTTLQQTASIGKVDVGDLINKLRKIVGQDTFQVNSDDNFNSKMPEWFNEESVIDEFDVSEMLASGEHPVNHVIAELQKMDEEKIFKLIAPFLPAPLIDKASSLDFSHWLVEKENNVFIIYFCKT